MKPKSFDTNHGVISLAKEAGVSITTASRKLKQGKTKAQIIDESAAWKAKQDRKSQRTGAAEPFFAAQTRKERTLADLRELELATKRAELIPLAVVNAFVSSMI